MKKILVTMVVIFLLLFASQSYASNYLLWASCRTGGGACLDGINGSDIKGDGTNIALQAGDAGIVIMDLGSTTPSVYIYRVYASSASESDPDVITPDTNPGTLRWHLIKIYALLDSPIFVDDITIAAAGVKLTGANGALTILGLGDGADEDVKIDLNTTANTIIVSSPTSSATVISLSALNLVTTGTIQGGIVINSDANGMSAAEMTAVGVRGTLFIASGAGTWILPTAVAGMSLCVMDSGTSHDLIVDVTTNDYIILKGTTLVQNAGITNAATATTGDFVCLVATAAGYWSTMGMGGAWVTQ